ncbi:phage tail protein [Liquorilactobacillus mali]|uniref:phage tail protein n=1 Tax=Liquorilactobacillus mali TaxID=1618 RepID=UPI00235051A2|nr:phage tail protein [Liquorilactobacillus mali]MDC7953606.1 phage tail protein [Liquorilactobacillus mali]
MILFRDENNIGYVAQVTISKTDGVNGEKSNTGIIYFGDEVKNKISRGWSYIFQNEEYVITTHTWNDQDNTVSFTAVHRFFYELSKRSLYESWTGSHTFAAYLNAIFKNTNYTFSNTANVAAFEKDNWGMTDKLTLFNDIIDQANVEFYVSGNTVYILEKVGTDLSTIVRKKFNLDTASIEADNSAFATYGRGYGAYSNPDDTSSNRLMVEYKSPLYDVYYPKFGAIEMVPVDNQNYKIAENLLSAVKAKVDASYTFSLSMTLLDLKQAGYPYEMAKAGDYLTVVDEELNFADKVRIIKVVSNYDINGNCVTCEVECGNLSFATQQKTSTATISEIVEGKALIPNSWLSNEITSA